MKNNKNYIGSISLLISIAGLIVVQILISIGFLKYPFWHILLAGFEAATIGGFADWFAVRALFYEIPIPIIRKHTNIIVRNRQKLTEGVVDLVTNKWLSPEIINEKLHNVHIVEGVIKTLNTPENKKKVIGFLKEIISRLTANIDDPEVAKMFEALLKEQIKGVDLATPLGVWLKKSVQKGDHNKLWDIILDAAEKSISDETTRELLLTSFKNQVQVYKQEGVFKKIFIGIANSVGAIDSPSILDKIISSIDDFIKEAKGNPNHAIRVRFDKSILDFADNLLEGHEDSTKIIKDLQDKLIDNADANSMIQVILSNFKILIKAQLETDDTPFINFLSQNVDKLLNELETDKAAQLKIDTWLKATIEELVTKYHHEIGEMVRLSLTKLNDFELVTQIEEKVGNDLQYIRLNGAVVGGFIGIVISLIRMIFL
jgi:uncharacterized membrane-anchored protein YjiN (DUF445 family)